MPIRDNYPPIYDGNTTIDVLSYVQQIELNAQKERIKQVFNNNFVLTADEEGVQNYERFLNILAFPDETLDYRKIRIISKLSLRVPFTRLFLFSFLDFIFGVDQYRLDFPRPFKIRIRVSNIPNARFLEGLKEVRRFIPANVVMETLELRKSWGELKKEYTTWGQPFALATWRYLENEKWNSTPHLSWRDRYRILDPINGGVMGLKPNFNTWNDATIIKLEEVENG